MNPEQMHQLFQLLDKIATGLTTKPIYTLTGAQDWGMLLSLFGVIVFLLSILILMVGFMWKSASSKQQNDVDAIWHAMARCQDNCCDFGRRRSDREKHAETAQ